MDRIGILARDDGPKIFLLKGKIKRHNYDAGFLVQHGLKPASTIIMTENDFMTHGTWFEASKVIVKGYLHMPVIRDNPQWDIL